MDKTMFLFNREKPVLIHMVMLFARRHAFIFYRRRFRVSALCNSQKVVFFVFAVTFQYHMFVKLEAYVSGSCAI